MTSTDDGVALDVALLVPEPLLAHCVAVNAALVPPPRGFRLDADHLAHITLVQQFIRAHDLKAVTATLDETMTHVEPLSLRVDGLGTGGTTSVLRLTPTDTLARLHRALMDRLGPFEVSTGDGTAFVTDQEPVRPADVRWVQRFRQDAAYDRFSPHITLGVGPVADWTGPSAGLATTLALCQLGRYCTCRRVLTRWTLTPRDP